MEPSSTGEQFKVIITGELSFGTRMVEISGCPPKTFELATVPVKDTQHTAPINTAPNAENKERKTKISMCEEATEVTNTYNDQSIGLLRAPSLLAVKQFQEGGVSPKQDRWPGRALLRQRA